MSSPPPPTPPTPPPAPAAPAAATPAACERCQSPLEPGDLRCAICGHAAPEPASTATAAGAAEATVTINRCRGCGAAVAFDVEARAPRCAFCGSVMAVEKVTDPLEQTARFLPFTVDAQAARRALRTWLGRGGWFRPPDLVHRAAIDRLRSVWWPGWVFDAEALISWTADADLGARRAAWAPHAGQTRLAFDDIGVPASRGLTPAETAALWPSYRLDSATDERSGPDGTEVEPFELHRSQARRTIVATIEELARRRVAASAIPGRRHRNIHVACLLHGLVTRRHGFPAWILAYRYRGHLYRAVLSGQDGATITGSAPYSAARIAVAVVAALAALAAVVALLAAAG